MPASKAVSLTEKAIEKLAPTEPGKRREVADIETGLVLRVSGPRNKTWNVLYRVAGKGGPGERSERVRGPLQRISIGPWPLTGVKAARERAREIIELADRGIDPAAAREEASAKRNANAFESVLDRFVELHVKQNTKEGRFARDRAKALERAKAGQGGALRGPNTRLGRVAAERIVATHALPIWRGRQIETITRAEVHEDAARRDAFHPVVDYLSRLQWDGIARLDQWLSTYLGAADTDYTRHVGAIMLTAAVRRVRSPGCKFDEMVVLESEQGKSKSTALAILAVREDWFSDDLPLGAESKVVIERTQGRWIIEAAELAGMGKKSIEGLKAFLSRRVDRSRMAYGRLPHEAPRHFIVAGTTNDDRYLSDSTGNRRFWPVRVGDIDLSALERDRDQLWAEAAAREAAGASIRLDRALWQAAAVEQDGRRVAGTVDRA